MRAVYRDRPRDGSPGHVWRDVHALDTYAGELYIDGSGNVVFRDRQAAVSDPRSTVPQAVFGDGGGAELPYTAVGRADDDTQLANDVQITRVGGTLQEASDAASIAKYLFPRSYARADVLLQSDAEALIYARWVLYVSLAGEDRFDTLTINPLRDPVRLFPQVLQREIGDLITVTRRPPGMAAITKNVFIRGITHTIDASSSTWQTVWDLQDASRYAGFLILDDPVLGKLNTGKLAF
jgi:hypothetical protein